MSKFTRNTRVWGVIRIIEVEFNSEVTFAQFLFLCPNIKVHSIKHCEIYTQEGFSYISFAKSHAYDCVYVWNINVVQHTWYLMNNGEPLLFTTLCLSLLALSTWHNHLFPWIIEIETAHRVQLWFQISHNSVFTKLWNFLPICLYAYLDLLQPSLLKVI